jgi:hypothetical protein
MPFSRHRAATVDLQAAFAFYCGKRNEQPHRADQNPWAIVLVHDAYRARRTPAMNSTSSFPGADRASRSRLEEGELAFCFGKHAGRRLNDVFHDNLVIWSGCCPATSR